MHAPPSPYTHRSNLPMQLMSWVLGLLWLLVAGPSVAANYVFPGTLPSSCSGSAGTYTCSALTLNYNDTITINSPTPATITINGSFNTNNAKINASGASSNLTLVVTGTLTPSYQAVINADVTAGSVNDTGSSVTFGGSLTTGSGGVYIGWASTGGGSIRTSSGTITLVGSNTVTGSITSSSGSISLGNVCTVGGTVGSSGAVYIGQASIIAGTATSTGSLMTLGYQTQVKGDVTAHASTVTMGGEGITSACIRSPASNSIALFWHDTVQAVCCGNGATCSTSCVSNGSGYTAPPACAARPFVAGTKYSFESVDLPGNYIRQSSYLAYVSTIANTTTDKQDATFTARAGLYDSKCWSFESVRYPGYYLRHQNYVLKLHASDGSTLFKQDTTFCLRTGLASSSGISLETINYPGYFIRHLDDLSLGIAYSDGGADFPGRATFNVSTSITTTSGLDHLEIQHGSGTGLTCTPSTLTIKACQDAACATPYTAGVSGTLTASGTGMTVNWPSGAAFSIASGSSTTTESMQVTTPGAVAVGTSGLSVTATNATTCNFGSPSCTFTAQDSGFLFDVPDHVSEVSQTVSVSAVQKSNTSNACVPAFASQTKAITFKCSYSNPSSGTLPVRVGGSALNTSNSTAAACDTTGRAISLAFNASGVATTTVQYADAGLMQLNASYTGATGSSEAGLTMTGSDTFIAVPASFTVAANLISPATKYVAGSPFNVTVTAKNGATTPAATPNFGRESTPPTVTLARVRYAPTGSGANDGSLTSALGSFSSGVATSSTTAWSEVGLIDLTATVTNYLGSGLNVTGSTGTTGAVGPFIPHHFTVTTQPGCGTFSYSGQPFQSTSGSTTTYTKVTALNASGNTTANYDGTSATTPNYAKAVTLSAATNTSGAGSFGTTGAVALTSFSAGVASIGPAFTYSSKLTAKGTITVRAVDTDGVSSSGYAEGSMELRSGRLKLSNAFGSEKASLGLAAQTQYWSGNTWVKNDADSCTVVPAAAMARSNYLSNTGAATSAWTTTPAGPLTFAAGTGTLTLGAPSPSATGSVDIALNLGSASTTADVSCLSSHPTTTGAGVPWLQSQNGNCAATFDRDPSARATFGVYSPESTKTIHTRELY